MASSPPSSRSSPERSDETMRLISHLLRLGFEAIRYGFATRRMAVALVFILGLALLAAALTAQTVAPLALYPFA